ncbi:hypothetical protein F4778DRAFT_802077 [Xylariomycetidae sp. FL2044]|nr:hypothetical protein F4778DRAFT_802077 [Xylariomycetidae sp. FL2044]
MGKLLPAIYAFVYALLVEAANDFITSGDNAFPDAFALDTSSTIYWENLEGYIFTIWINDPDGSVEFPTSKMPEAGSDYQIAMLWPKERLRYDKPDFVGQLPPSYTSQQSTAIQELPNGSFLPRTASYAGPPQPPAEHGLANSGGPIETRSANGSSGELSGTPPHVPVSSTPRELATWSTPEASGGQHNEIRQLEEEERRMDEVIVEGERLRRLREEREVIRKQIHDIRATGVESGLRDK